MVPLRGLDERKHTTVGGSVYGHHAAIDNASRMLAVRLGYYGDWRHGVADAWVRIDMRPLADYLPQQRGN